MVASPRQIVRSAVGLAAVAPAIGLIVLAVALVMSGGFSGVLAGVVVAGIAALLLAAALLMTHAPVTISNLLQRTDEERDKRGEPVRTNGHGPPEKIEAGDEAETSER